MQFVAIIVCCHASDRQLRIKPIPADTSLIKINTLCDFTKSIIFSKPNIAQLQKIITHPKEVKKVREGLKSTIF